MTSLNNPRLVLTPKDKTGSLSDFPDLISSLIGSGFIGQKRNCEEAYDCYETGDDFLHQVTFLGCSPTLINDSTGENEIFVSIYQSDEIIFAHSSDVPPPRCPHCNKSDKNWRLHFQQWQSDKLSLSTCPNCRTEFPFTKMKWKKNGGYGKLLIQIHGVQEQLAVPNPQFLDMLQQISGTSWEFFFADH